MAARARSSARVLAAVVVVVLVGVAGPALADDEDFGGLDGQRRIYDQTASSLTDAQAADLNQTATRLVEEGLADVVVVVRELDADPDDTLDQAEALQQQWVDATGADEDTAVGILINREPGADDQARAGLYLGTTLDDGNVPESEQRDIVDGVLIPPLRTGDVNASIADTLARLRSDIENGPPPKQPSAFDQWAERNTIAIAGGATIAALLGVVLVLAVGRRPRKIDDPVPEPTTQRPGDLSPTLAGALVAGTSSSANPTAPILDLAGRGGVELEHVEKSGMFSSDHVALRLVDGSVLRDDVDHLVWAELEKRAVDGRVDHKGLGKAVAALSSPLATQTRADLDSRDWRDSGYTPRVSVHLAVGAVALIGVVLMIVAAVAASSWAPAIGAVALVVLIVIAFIAMANDSPLTPDGQREALRWTAYRDGFKDAVKDPGRMAAALADQRALADVVGFGLGERVKGPLQQAADQGITIGAFSSLAPGLTIASYVPMWAALSSTMSTSSSSSTVSGGGAGGGGGAAGST